MTTFIKANCDIQLQVQMIKINDKVLYSKIDKKSNIVEQGTFINL